LQQGLVGNPLMCSLQEAQVIAQTMKTAQTGLRLDIGPLRSLVAHQMRCNLSTV